ncbi:MAG: glycosyltransferase family 4 protein, partial [Fimbriimonadaceae bacterium]
MRIVLSTTTMSTTFNMARGIHEHNPDTFLFAGYPADRLAKYGFPPDKTHTYAWPILAMFAVGRVVRGQGFHQWVEPWPKIVFDRHVAGSMGSCDVFYATSSVGLESGRKAKRQGAAWICERPCSHIETQDGLLRDEYARHGMRWPGIHRLIIEREKAEYEESDAIVVASEFSRRSLVERGVPEDKIWVIPYGVNLESFYPDGDPMPDAFHVLYVGQRSIRKGLAYLLDAFEALDHPAKRLTLIGADTPDGLRVVERAKRMPSVEVIGSMPQPKLRGHMSRADVFVLPSVEDGYGMVVDQAMACGCPCIVSRNAGAADSVAEGETGYTFEARDVGALTRYLQELADNPER